MKHFRIVRGAETDDSTFGIFELNGVAFAVTLELPWRDNKVGLSRIPPGTYRCVRFKSPRFKIWTYEILGVWGRSKCLLHPANLASQLEGCVAVGHGFDFVAPKGHKPDDGIVQSVKEFEEFMKLAGDDEEIMLTIDECFRKAA